MSIASLLGVGRLTISVGRKRHEYEPLETSGPEIKPLEPLLRATVSPRVGKFGFLLRFATSLRARFAHGPSFSGRRFRGRLSLACA
jgi:hypothetical protein